MKLGPITTVAFAALGLACFSVPLTAQVGVTTAQVEVTAAHVTTPVMTAAATLPDAPTAVAGKDAGSGMNEGGLNDHVDNDIAVVPYAQPYHRPSQHERLNNYFFEAFGPYPIVAAAFTGGINQLTDSPPEWQQGLKGYGRRFGSNMGIVATTTTARFALSEALDEDDRYYRCGCTGILPRLSHAMIATFTARHGADGRHVFSVSALVAPYVGTETAVHAWYPDRYGAKDAFRMGNYVLLGYMGQNISIEFLDFSHGKSLLEKFHLNNRREAPVPDSPPTPAPVAGPGE